MVNASPQRGLPEKDRPVGIPSRTRHEARRRRSRGEPFLEWPDDAAVDEMERESFPASDPPSTWAGPISR